MKLSIKAAGLLSVVVLVSQMSIANAVPTCEVYSEQALVLAGKNLAFGCGFAGDRWSLDGRAHFAFCQAVGVRAAAHDRLVRTAQVNACHH